MKGDVSMFIDLLDPSNEVVFNLLLVQNRALLLDMLESVLNLPNTIQDQLVLNPEACASQSHGFPLNVWVRLRDNRKLVLSVQSTTPQRTGRSFLWQWTRGFVATGGWAVERPLFEPRISILWSRGTLSRSVRFHSVFQLTEDHSKDLFGPELEFHLLNLEKVPTCCPRGSDAKIVRWARFLNARSISELEALAREDAVMEEAKVALVKLSRSPGPQQGARLRGVN
jgi:hypothetical protein